MVAVDTAPSRNDTTADRLRYELIRVQIEALRLDIKQMQLQQEKQEQRLRLLEETATKFNFILYLTMGGGLIGLLNLVVQLRP